MSKYGRHAATMLKLRDKLEEAYSKATDSKRKEEILWKLVDYRMIKSDDKRLESLSVYSRKKRDARKSKMLSYVAKCPYLHYKDTLDVDVQIQPHDGVRSYKETTWQVKYPSSKTYIRLEELCNVSGAGEIKKNIEKIVQKQGCEWDDLQDEKFYKMTMNGYYLVYKAMFKNLTNTLFDFCGYIFVEKVHSGDVGSEVNVYPILDKELLKSKYLLPNVVEDDIITKVKESIEAAFRQNARDKEEALKAKKEAAEKEAEAENKKAKKSKKSKEDKSAEDMVVEALKLREALGMV